MYDPNEIINHPDPVGYGNDGDDSQFRHYQNPQHDEDEEIAPGLFLSDITSWKKQFNEQVYEITVKDEPYIVRPLERYEYKDIVGTPNTDPLIREEMICEYCVLYPQGFDFATMANKKAGLPAILSEFIMELSDFTKQVSIRKL